MTRETARVLKIEITCENQAFADNEGGEIARILRRSADKFANGDYPPYLFDANGNCVGECKFVIRRER